MVDEAEVEEESELDDSEVREEAVRDTGTEVDDMSVAEAAELAVIAAIDVVLPASMLESAANDTVAVNAEGVALATAAVAGGVHMPLLNVVAAAAGSAPLSAPASASVDPSSSCLLPSIGSRTSNVDPVTLVEREEGLALGRLTLTPSRGLVGFGARLRHARDAPGHMDVAARLQRRKL